MKNTLKKTFAALLAIFLTLNICPPTTLAFVAEDYAIRVSATVEQNPPKIILSWPYNSIATGYLIYRKSKEAKTWGSIIAELPAGSTGYTDTNVAIGQTYEYKITMKGGTGISSYIYSGINVPATEYRGKVILVVDHSITSELAHEIARFEQDLIGDGWIVLRYEVSRADSPQKVKAMIQAGYSADPDNVKSVFLLGHVPIPKSGYMGPDGHTGRPFPADSYYADMDGEWTDTSTLTNYTPGDGIFDQNQIPSDTELQIGRVDLWNLPAFAPLTEIDLIRRYLDKNHKYRMGMVNMQRRGFIQNEFPVGTYPEVFARNGWNNFAQLCNGANSITHGNWRNTLSSNDYLWGYICGPGTYTSIAASYNTGLHMLNTNDFVHNKYKVMFAAMFGSYFGEWDTQNNLLRAFLGMEEYGLANAWAGRPHWFFHHMGLGEPIGYSQKLTQNNDMLFYQQSGNWTRGVHIALMGDPTLRLYPVAPPSNVTVRQNQDSSRKISWDASPQTVLGYHVYRINHQTGNYERISDNIITDTQFTDAEILPYPTHYMVRSVLLEASASGTFYNLSQGIQATRASSSHTKLHAAYIPANNIIHISGQAEVKQGEPLNVKIIDSEGTIVYVGEDNVSENGKIQLHIPWGNKMGGTYKVTVGYNNYLTPWETELEIFSEHQLNIEPIYFTDKTNHPVTTLIRNTTLIAKAAALNQGNESVEVKFVVALYDQRGSLKTIAINTQTIAPKVSQILQSEILLPDEDLTGCYVKAFLWDDFVHMNSLTKPGTFPNE